MIQVSFVIIYHPSRIKNLQQCLRLLSINEPNLIKKSELILVCQSSNNLPLPEIDKFMQNSHIHLEYDSYQKPKMTNIGVSKASSDKIILLDSDRILPYKFFETNVNHLKKLEVISARKLHTLLEDYSDEEILNGSYLSDPDFKSTSNAMFRRNLFAGNTILHTEDYWKLDGYDETFNGYGFSDTDMSEKAIRYLKPIWREDKELHLKHPLVVIKNNTISTRPEDKSDLLLNACRFMKKWKKKPCMKTMDIFEDAIKNNKVSKTASNQIKNFILENKIF